MGKLEWEQMEKQMSKRLDGPGWKTFYHVTGQWWIEHYIRDKPHRENQRSQWANLFHYQHGHKGYFANLQYAQRAAQSYEDSTNRLVHFIALPPDARGGMKESYFQWVTPLGKEVIEKIAYFIPDSRMPFTGCNSKGIYLKWLLSGKDKRHKPVDEIGVLAYRDWLLDKGLQVEVSYPETPVKEGIKAGKREWIKLDVE